MMAGGWRWPTCHLPTNQCAPSVFFKSWFINDFVQYTLMTMICTARQIHWIWLLTHFDSHPMIHIFYFYFLFLIFYFNYFKFQKIKENSFLVQKIWKNYEKYFWLFSFCFLFFHNLILCIGIFYKFYTYLICFKCLKILLYILKFWKNYEWSNDIVTNIGDLILFLFLTLLFFFIIFSLFYPFILPVYFLINLNIVDIFLFIFYF